MKWATDLQLSQGTPSQYDLAENADSGGIRRPNPGVIEWLREHLGRAD